jgi:hypothetical protein
MTEMAAGERRGKDGADRGQGLSFFHQAIFEGQADTAQTAEIGGALPVRSRFFDAAEPLNLKPLDISRGFFIHHGKVDGR